MQAPPSPAAPRYSSGAPAEEEDWGEDDEEPRDSTLIVRDEGPAFSPEEGSGAAEELALASDLRRLEEVARRRIEESPRSRDTWTRIDVSPHLVLSARGIGEEDVALVQRVRQAMKSVIWRGR